MAKIYITQEMLDSKDGTLVTKLQDKYGAAFTRLRKEDKYRLRHNIGNVFSAFGGKDKQMLRPNYGSEAVEDRDQESYQRDMERLEILSKHRRELIKLRSQKVRSRSEEAKTYASLVRSATMMGVAKLSSDGVLGAAKIQARMNVVNARSENTNRQLAEMDASKTEGKKSALSHIQAYEATVTTGGTPQFDSYNAIADSLNSFGADTDARTAYIRMMGQLSTPVDPIGMMQSGAAQTVAPKAVQATAANIGRWETDKTNLNKKRKLLDQEALDNITAMGTIGAYAGIDTAIMETINAGITAFTGVMGDDWKAGGGEGATDAVGAVNDKIEAMAQRFEDEQDEEEAGRQPATWAEMDRKMAESEEFQRDKAEHAPGATDREYFRKRQIALKQSRHDEQEAVNAEQEEEAGMDHVEQMAAGKVLNANSLQRLVAKARVGGRNVAKGIASLIPGGDEEEEEEEGEQGEPRGAPLTAEELDLDALPEAGKHLNDDIDLLDGGAADPDDRVEVKSPSSEAINGAEIDPESPQAAGGEKKVRPPNRYPTDIPQFSDHYN